MARSLGQVPIVGKVVEQYRERLTPRGQYLFWMVVALAALGMDTRRTQVFVLFSVAAGLFLIAALYAFLPPPKVKIDCRMPERATTLAPLAITARISGNGHRLRDLQFSLPRPKKWGSSIRTSPPATYFEVEPERPANAKIELQAVRRGRYILRGAAVRATDPLRLTTTRAVAVPDQTLLAYPRFFSMEEFVVPLGRRYQPGGIPLSSNTGEAIEFVGTREYREGDPVKNIHWRSWARRGEPVVKEYQEEYFCRIALILDTFLPRKATEREVQAFEGAISVLASIADFFSRSEYIVDILAAGPDIYEVSAGRSLAYLENILDVLACLEPCYDTPFQTIGPHLFEKLAHTTTVVAVLQDSDSAREHFLLRVREAGAAVRAIVVHDGPTHEPWQHVGPELGEISQLTPGDIERLLASTGRTQ
jgi:uncharacterized protein (DUF58 family)